MLSDYFQLAVRNLMHQQRRSWLTIIGTLIGIMAVVSLISIGQGLESSIQGEFERLGGNKLFISPGGGITAQFSDSTVVLDENDLEAVKNTRGIDRATGEVSGDLPVTSRDSTAFISVIGIPTGEGLDLVRSSLNLEMSEGRYLRSTDRRSAVIGQNVAENSFSEDIGVRNSISINGTEFRIVGVAESTGNPRVDNAVHIPMDQARNILDRNEDRYDRLLAEVSSGNSPSEAKEDVEQSLRDSRNVEEGEEDFQIQTAEDIVSSFNDQLQIVRAVLVGIGSISLLVGGVGIMNTMYTSVAQRTREIGIMKAVGASQKQIMKVFLIESGIIGMIGGLIGATLGIAISIAATELITGQIGFTINAYISPLLVIGSIVFSFFIGMISGVLPARKAAKLEPVEALSYD